MDEDLPDRLEFSINRYANKIVDEYLSKLKHRIRVSGGGSIPIRDIIKNINERDYFTATCGRFEDISTIKKQEEFRVILDPTSGLFLLTGTLHLENFTLAYDSYVLNIQKKVFTGNLKIRAKQNTISLKFVLHAKNLMRGDVGIIDYDLGVTELSNIKVKTTGFVFMLNWVLEMKIKQYITEHKEDIINYINKEFKKKLLTYMF